ncbi:hypothetical protein COO60DRAFT_80183 [Scenedesmus sp. NREL 46B-D3]|nr:hypothetical protein COO60DRAFT_80183 [Scenedesmus sp. NREL 46B-D3]
MSVALFTVLFVAVCRLWCCCQQLLELALQLFFVTKLQLRFLYLTSIPCGRKTASTGMQTVHTSQQQQSAHPVTKCNLQLRLFCLCSVLCRQEQHSHHSTCALPTQEHNGKQHYWQEYYFRCHQTRLGLHHMNSVL